VVSKDGDVGYKAVRGILRYSPSDMIDAMVSADYIHDKRNASAEVLLYANNTIPTCARPTAYPTTPVHLRALL
jgi:iron complex outermembrane receptor protein